MQYRFEIVRTINCAVEFEITAQQQRFRHSRLACMVTAGNLTRAPRECKPLPTPKFETKVIRDSNSDFRINWDTDPDVRRICPKMLWMHVGVSHFAKYMVQIGR